jgi:glycosyltransferase involved in cell wall biosynthesis
LNKEEKALIVYDENYKSEESSLRDAAYQAWQKGILLFNQELKLDFVGILPIQDEYRFIKKYFNPFWIVYVLFLRLITLNNPIRELYAFVKALNTNRWNLHHTVNRWESYLVYSSVLKASNPLVSVVIPTLNRYSYLKDVLRDLEKQDYKNIEVIVVDQTEPFQNDFYSGWKLDLTVVHQQEKALWKARNSAVRISNGELILLYDDDSRVEPNWISEHLKCLDFFKADFSAGVSLSVVGAKIPSNYSFLRWADQFDTGNVMIRKDLFRKIGLFDRQFERQRMGDGEFGLRAYLNGFIGISNPYAKRIHLKVESGGLRQMGSWDGFRPTNWFGPRPIPSVLYLTRRYFGRRASILSLLINVPASIFHLKYKRNPLLLLLASFLAIFISPLLLYQVLKSWNMASAMIAQGPHIDKLD